MSDQLIENPEMTFFRSDKNQETEFTIFFHSETGIPASVEELKEFPAYQQGSGRIPFSVIFLVRQTEIYPQRIYKVKNQAQQYAEIFLVPVSHKDGMARYQAVFS